jgi:hypothetical protein
MKFFTPFKVLLALVITVSALQVAYVATGARQSDAAEMLTRFCLGLAFVLWIMEDARLRHRVPCYDFGFLVAIFFPVSLVWYVFWSRGWKGFLTLGGIVGLMVLPTLSAGVASIVVYQLV